MPFYDYFCPANNRTVEVYHGIRERLSTWGDVCARASISPSGTPPETPVQRLICGVQPTVFRLKGLDKDAPSTKLDLS